MKGLAVGQQAQVSRGFSTADLAAYASLTGEDADGQAASHIVPGPLIGGLFSYLLGTRLPGFGTNYLKQQLRFPVPAYVDEALTAVVEITRLRPDQQLVNLRTICVAANGRTVCEGEALVFVQDLVSATPPSL